MECKQRRSFASLLRPKDQRPAVLLSLTIGCTGRLLSGYSDGVVKVWTHTEEEENGIRQVSMFPTLSSGGITALCLGPTNMSAASGDQGGMIKLLDVEKNKVISGTSMQSPICSLGFKKQGHGFHLLCATNTNILLWDIRQKVAKCLELSTKNRLTTVAVTGSNESKVAAGCADGKILIWDIRTGFIDKVFSKHHSRVTSLGFPSSGNELAGGFQDGSLTICDIALMEEQVSRSEVVATSPVTSLEFSRNPTKLFAGAMGMISRLDLDDVNEPVKKMKLDDWESSAVKDMSQLRDTDQMILVCAQPILRTKIVNVINPMNQEWTIGQDYHSEEHPSVVVPDGIKKSECLDVKKDLVFEGENSIFIEESVVTGDEKCTTCMDDVGTSIELEIFGIKDENVLMADKPSTTTKNSVTSNIYAEKDASIENLGIQEENSIEDDVEMSGTDVDEILIEENVTTSNEKFVTNTVNVRQEHNVDNYVTLKEKNSEEKISETSYNKTLIGEGCLDTSGDNSPTKIDDMQNETPLTPEKYSTKSIMDTKNKTSMTKEDLNENNRLEHEVKDTFGLKEGMTFKCKNDVVIFMKEFCHKQKTAFIIQSNQSKTGAGLMYSCKHGIKRKSESTGKRVIQRSVKKNCPAYIRFYVRKSGETVLKKFNVNHENHYVNENIFIKDVAKADDEALTIIRNMMDGNCKVGNIKRALAKNGIYLSWDQVRYQVRLILGEPMNEEKLSGFVKLVRDEGGNVEILRFPDEKIRVFTITTIKMKRAFIGSNPSVVQVDTTFGFERSGYKLNAILYCNPSTGKGEIVQLSFMADETLDSYNFVMSKFKEIVYWDPSAILIDKDFTEWRVLEMFFPNSTVLLCTFHVLKWMKSLFATLTVSSDIKYEINEIFRSLVYAKDEIDFNRKLENWNKVVDQDVHVRLGTGEHAHYVNLADYYEKNWAPIRHMWAWCERKRLPIGEENTNNRLECAFRKLKEDLKMSNIGEVTIEVAVMSVVRWAELKLLDAVTQAQRKDVRIYEENPDLQLEYDNAVMELNETGVLAFRKSVELLKKFESKMLITEDGVIEKFSKKRSESNEDEVNEKIYRASETCCSCTKWHQSHFVCRHILFVRREKNLPLFQKNLFSEYFHRERYGDLDVKMNDNKECIEINGDMEQIIDEDVEDNTFVLTPEEKFKISSNITSELRELFCYFGTEQFTTYMWELEVLKRKVRRGLSMISSTAKVTDDNKVTDVVNLDKNVQVENFEAEKFKFLEIIRKKGRPKYSGAGKLKFPKPKKRSLPSIKPSEESVVSDAISVTDTDVSMDQPEIWTEHICLAPPVPGQPSDNVITKFDYAHLAPKSYVTTTTINWWLSLLDKQYTIIASKNIRPVLVLCTEFYQKLEAWDLDSGMPDKNIGLQKWTESAQLWHGGSRIVILPLCWIEHFYTLVAVLDNRQPMLYILESIGGYYAKIPPNTEKFCSYLQLLRVEQGGNGPGFKSMLLTVPRQKERSNDCGMFCLKFIEMILENPEDFETRASKNDFVNWFDIETVDVKRKQLVARIEQLAVEQRMPGGVMFEHRLDLPLPQPEIMLKQIEIQERRKNIKELNRRKNMSHRITINPIKVAALPAAHIPSTRIPKRKETSVSVAPVCKDLESEGVKKNKIEEGDISTVADDFEEPEEDSLLDIEREFKKSRKSSVSSMKEESLKFSLKKYLKKVSAKPAKPRRCGLCNKVGHNRRVCDFRSFIDEDVTDGDSDLNKDIDSQL